MTDDDTASSLDGTLSCHLERREGISYFDPKLVYEVCLRAPVIQIAFDLGSYRPLGPLHLTWPRSTGGRLETGLLETSRDGVTWQKIGEVATDSRDRVVNFVVWTRYVRLRATPDSDPTPPRTELLLVNEQTGGVTERDADRERPVNTIRVPRAEVTRWPGSLAGIASLREERAGSGLGKPDPAMTVREAIAVLLAAMMLFVAGFGWWRVARSKDSPDTALNDLLVAASAVPLALAGLALVLPLMAVIPFIGLLFLGVAYGVAGYALVASLPAWVVLVVCLLSRQPRPVRGLALVSAPLVVFLATMTLFNLVNEAPDRLSRELRASAVRTLPVTASPVEVVDAALGYAASGKPADQAKVCALLIPTRRSRCDVDDANVLLSVRVQEVVRRGNEAIVRFSERGGLARLRHSERGWELIDELVEGQQSDCLPQYVDRGRDPFGCPT